MSVSPFFTRSFPTAVIEPTPAILTLPACHLPRTYSYDALKAQIYKFEKSALDSQSKEPPTSYRDDHNSADVEGGQASAADAHKAENERVFVAMLDKEVHKITDFYVSKGSSFFFSSSISGFRLDRNAH